MIFFRRVKVRVNLRKCNKNIFLILSDVRQAMLKANKGKKYNQLWNEVMKTTKYADALKVIKKYVKIIDTSNLEKV